MQIIPALFIQDGKLAVFRPGDLENIEFLEKDPYDLISEICNHEIRRIHLLDVDASHHDGKSNSGLIGSLSNTTVADLEVEGGIDNMDYLKSLQFAGVDYFVLGSAALENFEFLVTLSEADHVKNDKVAISLNVLDGQLTIHGWTKPTEGVTIRSLIQKCIDQGFSRFICTDVDTDHLDEGPDIVFYKELVEQFPDAIFTAAGHINNFDDIARLKAVGIHEVLVGNEVYKKEGLLKMVSAYNKKEEKEES